MKKQLKKITLAAAMIVAVSATAQAANLTAAGYTQNFDVMGTTTVLPTSWTAWNYASGSHSTWTATGIPASAIVNSASSQVTAGSAKNDGQLTSSDKSATTFYNVGITNSATTTASSNRALATSPTGGSGNAIQLSLTNTTGAAINDLYISYDMIKTTDGSGQGTKPYTEELPGYQLFYSLDNGTTYTNIAALNPVLSTAANPNNHPVIQDRTNQTSTTFVNLAASGLETTTSVKGYDLSLGASALANNGTILFRWVDDNGVTLSPDFVVGLDNVSITTSATPTPIPAAFWLLGSGLMGLFGMRKRKQC